MSTQQRSTPQSDNCGVNENSKLNRTVDETGEIGGLCSQFVSRPTRVACLIAGFHHYYDSATLHSQNRETIWARTFCLHGICPRKQRISTQF